MTELPAWVAPLGLVSSLLAFTILETLWPLRRRVESRGRRFARNAALAAFAYATVGLVQVLAFGSFAAWVEQRGVGILHIVDLPAWGALIAGVLLLDWMLWVWHILNHRVPFLWRFHAVHHLDLDLDASTGLRFHFGELALSFGVRAVQLIVIGPSPLAVGLWQSFLFASISFHHSNLRLPLALERLLVHLVATPRMHGIHHSTVRAERDANFASVFTVWDRLHGTLRLDVPQQDVLIGVLAYQERRQLTLGKLLIQPFRRRFPIPDPVGPCSSTAGPITRLAD